MLKLATLPLQTHCWIANVLQDDVHSSNTVALSRVIRFAGSCKVYKSMLLRRIQASICVKMQTHCISNIRTNQLGFVLSSQIVRVSSKCHMQVKCCGAALLWWCVSRYKLLVVHTVLLHNGQSQYLLVSSLAMSVFCWCWVGGEGVTAVNQHELSW